MNVQIGRAPLDEVYFGDIYLNLSSSFDHFSMSIDDTVDGSNPAPVEMENLPLFTGFCKQMSSGAGFLPSNSILGTATNFFGGRLPKMNDRPIFRIDATLRASTYRRICRESTGIHPNRWVVMIGYEE